MNTQNTKISNLTEEQKDHIYDFIALNNEPTYNLTKAAEELQELALVLLQRVHKGEKVLTSEIIDEIGDVKLRLRVLESVFSTEAVEARVNKKLTQYQRYIDTKKFKNI